MSVDKVDWVKINEKANELYELAKFTPESKNYPFMPNPEDWLYNQAYLRGMWMNYKESSKDIPQMVKDIVMTNSFSTYMEFMYNSYPDCNYKFYECYNLLGHCRNDVITYSSHHSNPLLTRKT